MIREIVNGLRGRFTRQLGPGGKTQFAHYLDQRAAKRVLEAIIAKTNDVETVRWLGRPIWQYPLDAWVLQEMIGSLKPDLIVETGTCLGGSAYFFASIFDLLGHGEVMSIDIAPRGTMPHPRITYLRGSSTDSEIVANVRDRMDALKAKAVLIMLDSNHTESHVRDELEMYAPLVPVGSYIYVQDGCIDTLPSLRAGRPGPVPAVQSFLKNHLQFVRDTEVEFRYVMTAHPYGWLRRVALD
jgi:cephalosporin hydroxylase